MERSTITGLIAIVANVAIASFVGCLEEEPESTSIPTQIATSSPKITPTPTLAITSSPTLTPSQIETPSASTHTKASPLTFEELITAKEKLGTLEEKYIELEKRLGAYGNRAPSEIEGNYDSIRNDLIELRDEFLSLKEVCLEFCNDNEELCSIKNPDTYVFNEELFNAMIEEADGWYELSEDYHNIHNCFRQYIFYKNIANRPSPPIIIDYETYDCDDGYYKINRIFNRAIHDRSLNGYLLVSKYGNSKDFSTLPVGYVEWDGNHCNRAQKLKQTSNDPEIYLCKTESDKAPSYYYDVAIISDGFLIKYNGKPLEGPSGLFPGGILYSYNEISEMLTTDVDFSSLEGGNYHE